MASDNCTKLMFENNNSLLEGNCSFWAVNGSCPAVAESCTLVAANDMCFPIPNNCTLNDLKICSWMAENCSISSLKSCDAIRKWREISDNETKVPHVTIVLLVASVVLFTLLILRDGAKGFKRKAHWIPCDFLVLSALTIQLLNLISTQGQPLNWEKRDILLVEFWMIHTSRILLCIVVAYLVPAMADPGADDFWGKITSLAITVFLHVISELYFIKPSSASNILKNLWPRQRGTNITLYYVLAALMFFSFVMLLLLLACANIAGRGIERIVAHRTPLILNRQEKEYHPHSGAEEDHPHSGAKEDHHYDIRCQECWQSVEDSVFRAWIIAHAYALQYVVARSPLAASAATIVTIQIAITIVAGVLKSPQLLLCKPLDKLRFAITMMQCVFILIGWSMILWRWVTAVIYNKNRSTGLHIEDFWTRHLKELQDTQLNQPEKEKLLEAKIKKQVVNQSTKLSLPWYVLYVVIWVQLFTAFFSKACWLVSLKISRNRLMDILLSCVLFKCGEADYEFNKQLERVQLLEETPKSLWLSNFHSIQRAKKLILRGEEVGEQKCKNLVEFVSTNRTGAGLGLSCLDPSKNEPRLRYLCKIGGEQVTDMGKKQWKMTAVSLMTIITQLSPICAQTGERGQQASTSTSFPRDVKKDCLDAYSLAWDIIDFVDRADEEDGITTREVGDEIISDAADKYFSTVLKKGLVPFNGSEKPEAPQNVKQALMPLINECKGKTEMPGATNAAGLKDNHGKAPQSCQNLTGSDSTDWKEAAWKKAVYKLCISMDCSEDTNVNDLLNELQSCLADIINECLKKTQHLLLLNCRKWALNNGERNIVKALYTAGKAKIIMKML